MGQPEKQVLSRAKVHLTLVLELQDSQIFTKKITIFSLIVIWLQSMCADQNSSNSTLTICTFVYKIFHKKTEFQCMHAAVFRGKVYECLQNDFKIHLNNKMDIGIDKHVIKHLTKC